jgi:flagellin-specific chaperone FliS
MDEANAKIQGAERTLQSIDMGKLANEQQETYQTIHSFLSQAREALSRKDFPQALNLAQKAQILSSELSKTLR